MRNTFLTLFLISGLTGCGESHSHVDFVEPSEGTTTAETEPAIVVGFDRTMNPATIDSTSFLVEGSESGPVLGFFFYDQDSSSVTFLPGEPFRPGETITVVLTSAIESMSRKSLRSSRTEFRIASVGTPGSEGFEVVGLDPPVESTGAPRYSSVIVEFSSPFNPFTVSESTFAIEGERSGSRALSFPSVFGGGSAVEIGVDRPFLAGERIVVAITPLLTSLDGAIWARASTTREFYVAGTGVHPIANGMATAADWMSAASFISMAGLIAFLGYDASVYLMGWTGGYVLLALLLAPYLRKFGKFTVPEFIGERYYSRTARLVAVLCLIVASITYVIGQMKGVGVAFGRFLEVDFKTGVGIGMGIVFIYAVMGGMKGITYTQIAQYCVLIFAYTVPAIFISLNLTGMPIPQIGLGSTMADGSGMALLDKLDLIVTDLGFAAFTAQKGTSLNMFLLTLSLMIGTAGLPHVIVRFFTVPKVSDARISAGWALVFIAILYTTAPAVGAMARLNLTETIQMGAVGTQDGNLKYEERPDWFKNWETTGLLKFEDKNGDGRIQYYNDMNEEFAPRAEAYGWKGNEMVKIDRRLQNRRGNP